MLSNNVQQRKKQFRMIKPSLLLHVKTIYYMNSFLSTKLIFLIYEGNDYDSKPAVAQLTLVVQETHDLILLTETVARHR